MLLLTGKCRAGCYYCPLSQEKLGRKVVFADELRVREDADILEEAGLIGATGTGMTGGDPLIRPDETARILRLLKDNLGERHHVHLYTACADGNAVRTVARAGLDEIRFHPSPDLWNRLQKTPFDDIVRAASDLGLSVGLEIPAIPNEARGISALLDFAEQRNLSFVNLNELEFSESNWRALADRGFRVKDDLSSAVKGSEQLSLELIRQSHRALPIHYCSSSFKDGVQLRRRILRRGRRVRRPLDILTEDGTLIMGIIETTRPASIVHGLKKKYEIPEDLLTINRKKGRVEIASWVLNEIAPELHEDAFIIEEYPTADRLEVEREKIATRH